MDFTHKSTFKIILKPWVSEAKDKYLAEAALKDIARYLPANVDPGNNVDLLPFATNAFVANRINKNDDVSDGPTSVSLAKHFVNKPVNIEHNRQKVMGVILTYAFSTFGTDEPLTEKQAIASTEPFNVVLGGVLWRIVSPQLASIIEDSSDPQSENFEKVSASWEVGFMDYGLAQIEGSSKNLADAELITDPDKIKKLSPHLRAYKGKGSVKDGTKLYRVIQQGALPLGIGLTETPAADVKGVATQLSKEPSLLDKKKAKAGETDVEDETVVQQADVTPQVAATNEQNKENISQNDKTSVIENIGKSMPLKITKIEELTDDVLKQSNASEVSQFIKDQLKAANETYVTEKAKLETSVQTAQSEQTKQQGAVAQLQKDLETANKSLQELKEKDETRAKQDTFNSRMAALEIDFNLSNDERKVIAGDIAGLDDAAYAKVKAKYDVLLASKKKTAQASAPALVVAPVAAPAVIPQQQAVASKDAKLDAVDAALANATPDPIRVPQTPVADAPKSSIEKYKSAFGLDQWLSPDVNLAQ